MLITVLIDKIYLYDDYAIIFFNTQEKEYNVKVPTIEEAEVRTNDISAHHSNIRNIKGFKICEIKKP